MKKIPLLIKNNRSCEGCTKCCEGYLATNIKGNEVAPGKPCPFVQQGVGCNIYKDRPKDPCKQFECFWRASEKMPIEFKPSETNVIVTEQNIDGIPYLALIEAGSKVTPEMLSWFISYGIDNRLNIEWQIGDKVHNMGSPDFNYAIARRRESINTSK